MTRRLFVCAIGTAVLLVFVFSTAHPVRGQTTNATLQNLVQFSLALFNAIPEPLVNPLDPPGFFQVKPQEFDPGHTNLVQAAWLNGTGCPTNATIALPNMDFSGVGGFGTFSDFACDPMFGNLGDPKDQHNEGLLLVKTGPTITNFASAGAELHNVKGITLFELGYDIRKFGPSASPLGSHCGAGAPRFNILTTAGFFFLGCSSPPPDVETVGNGWVRLRWGGSFPLLGFSPPTFALVPITGTVKRIQIVFDEAQDAFGGLDQFGGAVLDNIDVNGALVGHGATDAS